MTPTGLALSQVGCKYTTGVSLCVPGSRPIVCAHQHQPRCAWPLQSWDGSLGRNRRVAASTFLGLDSQGAPLGAPSPCPAHSPLRRPLPRNRRETEARGNLSQGGKQLSFLCSQLVATWGLLETSEDPHLLMQVGTGGGQFNSFSAGLLASCSCPLP